MLRTTLPLTMLTALFLSACGGGGSGSSATPPANDGSTQTVVSDPLDDECLGLIRAATNMYGQPTARNDVITSNLGTGLDQSVIAWDGISTIVTFAWGESIDGCRATFNEGGPAIGVPAFEVPSVTPATVMPAPVDRPPSGGSAGTSAANPIIIAGDPTCTTALAITIDQIGAPSSQTLLFPEETGNGTIQSLLFYTDENITGVLEQRPETNSCHVYFRPGIG